MTPSVPGAGTASTMKGGGDAPEASGVDTDLSAVRRKAWETRRARYGASGHAGAYTRGPNGSDPAGMLSLIIRLLAEGALSEGQVARATGLDRITIRKLGDERADAVTRTAGQTQEPRLRPSEGCQSGSDDPTPLTQQGMATPGSTATCGKAPAGDVAKPWCGPDRPSRRTYPSDDPSRAAGQTADQSTPNREEVMTYERRVATQATARRLQATDETGRPEDVRARGGHDPQKVEEVARAICAAEGGDPDALVTDNIRGLKDDRYLVPSWRYHTAEARAVLSSPPFTRLRERAEQAERERLPHMCRDMHPEIRHALSDDDERCPVCRERDRADHAEDQFGGAADNLSIAEASLKEARAEIERLTRHAANLDNARFLTAAEAHDLQAQIETHKARIAALETERDEARELLRDIACRIDRLRHLSAKATAGDWYHYDEVFRPQFGARRITEVQVRKTGTSIIAWSGFDGLPTVTAKKRNANAAFIVAAVAEVRRQIKFFDRRARSLLHPTKGTEP